MPPRSRPTARLLTPAGWVGLTALTAMAAGLVFTLVQFLPRA